MLPIRPRLLLLAAPLALASCGVFRDFPTIWGGESQAEKEKEAAVEQARSVQVPVESVEGVEIGRMSNGFLITAYGTAPGLGYSKPELRPRRGGAPGADGYIEYDFVATEPPAGFDMPEGTAGARALRADLPVPASALRGAAGIRVLALHGGAQLDFAPAPPSEAAGQQG